MNRRERLFKGPGCALHGHELDEMRHEFEAWREEQVAKHGFCYVYVPISEQSINAYTMGVKESFGHTDFQITLQIPMKVVGDIFHALVKRVKAGETFEPGKDYREIIQNYPVRMMSSAVRRGPLVRLLFPDKDGRFPGEGVSEFFEIQRTLDTVTLSPADN